MRLKLFFTLFFVYSFTWSQITFSPPTTTAGTFKVPAGVTSLSVECWGAGGAGGGVTAGLSLFAGGGGGGGAYSKIAALSVTPATVLNYKVGEGGTGANGVDGTDGGQTFFSTVSANGGLGGKFGNPSLGAGGAGGAASGAGIKFSGGNGATAAILNLVTINSGGGGGGAGTSANGGSANNATAGTGGSSGGGNGATGLALFSDGTNGAVPGGGGSGAASILSVSGGRKGGNGGNGKLNVVYTCPIYGLTAPTTADNVCTAITTTSLVRLTGLPNGDYDVTYNRSNPGQNGLTATMSVTGGTGIGTFTAVGLTTPGSSTITITNLTSEACTNTVNANNAVTINIYSASVGGTINTPPAICSGGTSGSLTLSGYTGTITGWEYSVDSFSSWTPISNTTDGLSPGILTQTTQFRALVKNGACSQTTSAITTVTVNPLPAITTTGTVNNICFSTSSQLATLPYQATSNTPVSYSIVWNPAAIAAGFINQSTTVFSFSSGGGNLNTIAIPANIAANTYSGTMTIQNANCSATQAIQITIVPKPSALIPGAVTEPTCITPTGSLTLSGLPSSVTWLIKQTGTASTTYTGTGSSYPISNLLPGNYQFTVEYTGSCISDISTNVVVHNLVTNTYNSSWSDGTPTINQNLVFASNYSSVGGGLGNISGCSCLVNSGVTVVMNSNDTLTIQNAVVNNGGTLTFENNASLLQNNAAAVNSGNIIYKRISTPMKNFDFTYWSSPVAGQTLFGLSPNTLWDKYLSYTGTGWHQEQYGASVMAKGIGYIIRTPKAGTWPNGEVVAFPYSQAVAFIGTPNNGNITGQSVNAGKFYLIGNPYPSAISADAFLFDNPNNSSILGGTVYFWTHNTPLKMIGTQEAYSSGDYATYNGVGGTLTAPAPSGGALPSGKIAAGQSFFALATANGTVMFNNGMRIQGNNNQFFKPPKTSKSSSLEKHRLWLNMTNEGGAFKQLLIGYVEGASNGYDNDFDGITFDGNAYIDFYSINENSKLTIQGRALPFNNSDIVNLGYRTVISGEFKISVNNADGMLSSHPVYLEDKLTHTITDLTQNDYVFNSSVGVFNNRFVLRYANATLSADEFEHQNNVLAWLDKKTLRINSTEKTINKVFVYDITGKLVYSDFDIVASEVAISTLKFKNEILLLKIVLDDHDIITKKIITASE